MLSQQIDRELQMLQEYCPAGEDFIKNAGSMCATLNECALHRSFLLEFLKAFKTDTFINTFQSCFGKWITVFQPNERLK